MKSQLIAIVAAVVLVGCGGSQQSAPSPEAKPEPPKTNAPAISIHDAAGRGNIEAVKQHIAAGTDVNMMRRGKDSPLHSAVLTDQREIVELLIANSADVNVKGPHGRTPLDWANNKEIAALLRKHGGKTGPELNAEGK